MPGDAFDDNYEAVRKRNLEKAKKRGDLLEEFDPMERNAEVLKPQEHEADEPRGALTEEERAQRVDQFRSRFVREQRTIPAGDPGDNEGAEQDQGWRPGWKKGRISTNHPKAPRD